MDPPFNKKNMGISWGSMAYSACWCHHTILPPMAKQSISFKPSRNFCKHQKEMELYICISRTFFSLIVALSTLQLAPHPPNYFCRGNSALDYPWSIPTSVCMSLKTKPRWRPITTDTPNSGHSHPKTEFSQGTTSPKKSGAQALLLHNTLQHHAASNWRMADCGAVILMTYWKAPSRTRLQHHKCPLSLRFHLLSFNTSSVFRPPQNRTLSHCLYRILKLLPTGKQGTSTYGWASCYANRCIWTSASSKSQRDTSAEPSSSTPFVSCHYNSKETDYGNLRNCTLLVECSPSFKRTLLMTLNRVQRPIRDIIA